MEAVDRLLAHEEIRQLAARYAVAIDSRDLDALDALFVGDVRSSFEGPLREIGVSILNVGTHVIDVVDDDNATGIVYCKGEIQDGDRWIHQAIVYFDTYARRDGRWLFVRRVHELFYGAEVGTNPLGLPPADWPANHDGTGTRPQAWESWQHFWEGGS